MFNSRLFGYDKSQVDNEIGVMNEKISTQQQDIDFLRNENDKLKNKLETNIIKNSNVQIEK